MTTKIEWTDETWNPITGCDGKHEHREPHADGTPGRPRHHHHDDACLPGLDWIVVGCETGPRRRPCRLEWVRTVVQQCFASHVPVFVKQIEIDGEIVDNPVRIARALNVGDPLSLRQWPERKRP